MRNGNIPALFAELTQKYGPVFEIRPPFAKPMIFIAGPQINHWTHRHGRMYLRAGDYFADFEKVYGAHGVLPSMDGADHFRLRKAMGPAYSRGRLAGQLDDLYQHARKYMATWKVGDSYTAKRLCRRMVNAQISPLSVSVDSQDIIDDLMRYKERALSTHIIKALPKFMLNTPGMKRRAKIELLAIPAVFSYGAVGAAQPRRRPIPLPFPDHHILQDILFPLFFLRSQPRLKFSLQFALPLAFGLPCVERLGSVKDIVAQHAQARIDR